MVRQAGSIHWLGVLDCPSPPVTSLCMIGFSWWRDSVVDNMYKSPSRMHSWSSPCIPGLCYASRSSRTVFDFHSSRADPYQKVYWASAFANSFQGRDFRVGGCQWRTTTISFWFAVCVSYNETSSLAALPGPVSLFLVTRQLFLCSIGPC